MLSLREGRGWTQEDLARRSGLSRQFIGRIERNLHEMSVMTLSRLAHGLGVGVGELVDGQAGRMLDGIVDGKGLLVQIGKRIAEMRQAKGWTQEQLANLAHMHSASIGRIERGETQTSVGALANLAGAFEIAVSKLLAR